MFNLCLNKTQEKNNKKLNKNPQTKIKMDWMNVILSLAVIYLYFMNRVNGVNIYILRKEMNYSLGELNVDLREFLIEMHKLEDRIEELENKLSSPDRQ